MDLNHTCHLFRAVPALYLLYFHKYSISENDYLDYSVYTFRHYPYTKPFYAPFQIGIVCISPFTIYCFMFICFLVRFSSYFYGIIYRRIFIPTRFGTVPQSRMNLVSSSLMRSLKPCPPPTFITRRISQLKPVIAMRKPDSFSALGR